MENLKMGEVKTVTEVAEKIRGLMHLALAERQRYGFTLCESHNKADQFGYDSPEYKKVSDEAKRFRESAESIEKDIKSLMWVLGVKPQYA